MRTAAAIAKKSRKVYENHRADSAKPRSRIGCPRRDPVECDLREHDADGEVHEDRRTVPAIISDTTASVLSGGLLVSLGVGRNTGAS